MRMIKRKVFETAADIIGKSVQDAATILGRDGYTSVEAFEIIYQFKNGDGMVSENTKTMDVIEAIHRTLALTRQIENERAEREAATAATEAAMEVLR